MQANPVRWFEIYVQDMPRARKFYESVFQFKLEQLPTDIEMWTFPMEKDKVGAGGALVKIEGFSSGGNSTLIYFASEDCAIEAARVVSAGGRIQQEKMSIGPYGFIAHVYDTEGNRIGIHSLK